MQDYIDDSYFPRKVTIYKIDKFLKLSPSLKNENCCDKMEFPQQLNTTIIIWRTTEQTHVSRHPRFGDDDGDNATFEMQNTHGQ